MMDCSKHVMYVSCTFLVIIKQRQCNTCRKDVNKCIIPGEDVVVKNKSRTSKQVMILSVCLSRGMRFTAHVVRNELVTVRIRDNVVTKQIRPLKTTFISSDLIFLYDGICYVCHMIFFGEDKDSKMYF
jgi:hypothetical protein